MLLGREAGFCLSAFDNAIGAIEDVGDSCLDSYPASPAELADFMVHDFVASATPHDTNTGYGGGHTEALAAPYQVTLTKYLSDRWHCGKEKP